MTGDPSVTGSAMSAGAAGAWSAESRADVPSKEEAVHIHRPAKSRIQLKDARTEPTLAELVEGKARRRGRRRRSITDKILIGVGLALILLMISAAVGAHVVTNRVLGDVQRVPDVFGSIDPATRPQKPAGTQDALNFLLVGVDTGLGQRTANGSDVVMVMHLGGDRRSASIVSIPKDSWVAIPGRGMNTVSNAYATGGGQLLVRTIEQLTGLRMDHFALVDFAGFRDITNAVGGVDVNGGAIHLDGDQALAYVRQPAITSKGDLERVRRQQDVMKALMAKVASRGLLASPMGTLKIADSVARSLSVDESLGQGDLRSLAFSLRHLKPGAVRFLTAPVSSVDTQGGKPMVHLNPRSGATLWDEIETGNPSPN
jgi:LCP family protein required for cell wall assembly